MNIRLRLGFLISYETGNPDRLVYDVIVKIQFRFFDMEFVYSSRSVSLKVYGPSASEDGEVLPLRTHGWGRSTNRSVKGLILDCRDRKMFVCESQGQTAL